MPPPRKISEPKNPARSQEYRQKTAESKGVMDPPEQISPAYLSWTDHVRDPHAYRRPISRLESTRRRGPQASLLPLAQKFSRNNTHVFYWRIAPVRDTVDSKSGTRHLPSCSMSPQPDVSTPRPRTDATSRFPARPTLRFAAHLLRRDRPVFATRQATSATTRSSRRLAPTIRPSIACRNATRLGSVRPVFGLGATERSSAMETTIETHP